MNYTVNNRRCSLAREHKDLNKWLLFVFSAPVTRLAWNNTQLTVDIGVEAALWVRTVVSRSRFTSVINGEGQVQ